MSESTMALPMPIPCRNQSLLDRLHTIESDLLSAATTDPFDLHSIHDTLLELEKSISSVSQASISYDFANATACRVTVLATSFLDLETYADAASSSLLDSTQSILEEEFQTSKRRGSRASGLDKGESINATLPQIHQKNQLEFRQRTGKERSRCRDRKDTLISVQGHAEAFSWLLKNLHNPYPSAAIKRQISGRSNVSLKTVNEWFSHFRRKIGWSTISRKHFQRQRHSTVDCAHRIFTTNTGHEVYPKEIVQEFIDMKSRAERFSERNFGKNTLTEMVDGWELGRNSDSGEYHRHESRESQYSSEKVRDRNSVDGSAGEDTVRIHSAVRAGAKRQLLNELSDDMPVKMIDECERPGKRQRLLSTQSTSRTASFSTSASSRASSVELQTPISSVATLPAIGCAPSIDLWLSSLSVLESEFVHDTDRAQQSRKRRLSNSDINGSPKRLRTSDSSLDCSRKIPVSMDWPCDTSATFDQLSHIDFSLPPPATFSGLTQGEPLQLDSFVYSFGSNPDLGLKNEQQITRSTIPYVHVNDPNHSHECSNPVPHESPCLVTDTSLLCDLPVNNTVTAVDLRGNDDKSADDVFTRPILFPSHAEFYTLYPPLISLDTSSPTNTSTTDHLDKLERIDRLLAEAAKLQQEIFG